MTPEERNLVTGLFDRLATLEDAQRDPEAERVIRDGLRQAPNAVYALVQTALVQDEALRRADDRIRQLEAGVETARDTSFLGGMRETFLGRRENRGSVPSVRPADAPGSAPSAWGTATQPTTAPPVSTQLPSGSGGGSFLGTAAAAAAGVIGGSLLLGSIRSMMGDRQGAFAAADPAAAGSHGGASPWSGGGAGAGDSELARQAGLDDLGRTGAGTPEGSSRPGLFGESGSDAAANDLDSEDGDDNDFDFDDGGDSGEE